MSSASAVCCQCSISLPLRSLSAVTSTSYGVQKSISVSRRGNSRCRLTIRALKQEGGDRERQGENPRDEISDLESALGLENKTVRNITSDKTAAQRRRMTVLDVLQEQIDANEENRPPENAFLKNLRIVGEYLIDKTENTGGQDNVVRFAFAIFPFWFLALLVTSGVVTLPFDVPFLHNLAEHLAETQ